MSASVYILHGTDDLALGEFLTGLKADLGDPSLVEMNTTVLDARTATPGEVRAAAMAVPFLASRRLVIVDGLMSRWTGKSESDGEAEAGPAHGRQVLKELIAAFDDIPETTALVLVERRDLPPTHPALKWAAASKGRGLAKRFEIPRGEALARWIAARAKALGGAFHPHAAQLLASAVGDDPRLAHQEILKLLTYVNFERPVEPDDVERLTPYSGETSVFAVVDALGERDARRAQALLHKLLRQQDAGYAFAMIVRQFRLLLQTRELLDGRGDERAVAGALGVQPFLARKLMGQARQFTLPDLESIYRKLLDMDLAIKSSQMDDDVALDALVVGLAR